MSRVTNKTSGMTLVEILVAMGIFALVMYFAFQTWDSISRQQWASSNKLLVKQQLVSVTSALAKFLPRTIQPNSTSDPLLDSSIWSCSANGPCSLVSDNRQDGIELLVQCSSTSGIRFLSKVPFEGLSTMNTADNCSVCNAGYRPIMTIKFYSAGVLTRQFQNPSEMSANKTEGIIGMGVCFSAPSSGVGPDPMVYNQWVVSIVPIYFSQLPRSAASSGDLGAILQSYRETLMLAPLDQLGSKIKLTK